MDDTYRTDSKRQRAIGEREREREKKRPFERQKTTREGRGQDKLVVLVANHELSSRAK